MKKTLTKPKIMAYKWKPNKSQRREFATNMKDESFASAYYDRKAARAEKRRLGSKFDYESAGGNYIPTQEQYNCAMESLTKNLTNEQRNACNSVNYGYTCKEKVPHDDIHIVNELIISIN